VVLDFAPQIPVAARFGVLPQMRARLRGSLRRSAISSARLAGLSGQRAAVEALVTGTDRFVFVCLASAVLGPSASALGTFVAAGLYKDVLVTAISRSIQLWRQRAGLRLQESHIDDLRVGAARDSTPTEACANKGCVRVSRLSFAYSGTNQLLFDSLDFAVEAGEFVAVKGLSGSGKSTLLRLLCGATHGFEGSIRVDGHDVSAGLRGVAAVLPTDRLCMGSIRNNVAYFRRGDDNVIIDALKLAGIADFVDSLPMRLDTLVGEGLAGLSSGQRQRLLLARAFFGRPALLLLDEATSFLDVPSEQRIIEAIRRMRCTTIMVAHRPEVWRQADKVYDLVNCRLKCDVPLQLASV